jgi:hypothetical protein
MAESHIRTSGISLGASGAGIVQLRHREDLVVRQSGRQEEGRREAPCQALRRVPDLRVVGHLPRAIDSLDRAAAGAVGVFTSKGAIIQGGSSRNRSYCTLNVKLWTSVRA